MRDPRPGLGWSDKRVAIRRRYGGYMASPEWYGRRERWAAELAKAHPNTGPLCVVCAAPWALRHDDLHHRTYARLGHEDRADLIPLCRPCHTELHRRMEANPEWRKRPRTQATDLLVVQMRRHHQNAKGLG